MGALGVRWASGPFTPRCLLTVRPQSDDRGRIVSGALGRFPQNAAAPPCLRPTERPEAVDDGATVL